MKIFSWGSNSHGQLGQGSTSEQSIYPLAFELNTTVKNIVGGGKHTIIVSTQGDLFTCGDNDQGQLAKALEIKRQHLFEILPLKVKIVKVSCGWDFNLGLSECGQVFGWGGNSFGQLGLPLKTKFLTQPIEIFGQRSVDVGTGLRHSVIVTEEGFVYSSGFGRKGQLGFPLQKGIKSVGCFTQVSGIRNGRLISCGEHHTALCTKDGQVLTWGDNKHGQLGKDPAVMLGSETPIVTNISHQKIDTLASGWSHNGVLTGEGSVILWGRNDFGQLAEPRTANWKPKRAASLDETKQLVLGSNHGVALKLNGEIWCWGWNEHGNCGNGSCENVYEPSILYTENQKPALIGTGSAHSFFTENPWDEVIELELKEELESEIDYETTRGIPRLDVNETSYLEFFSQYILKNRPAILTNVGDSINCSDWIRNSSLNVEYFRVKYGNVKVPVSDCGRRSYNVQEKCETKMMDYLTYWENYRKSEEEKRCLYLKDWHFTRDFPRDYIYRVPVYFASDWLNEYYDDNPVLNDDYRFVYIGPKGSWTPFHSDVFSSFSWSVNVSGRKKWVLMTPGREKKFKDQLGNLKYDLDFNFRDMEDGVFEVLQEKGEAIFVPSGWHHQVWNLEDTISINHNWINGCNVHYMWESMRKSLEDVKNEISDCRDAENWPELCQSILLASFGFNYSQFHSFLRQIAAKRIECLESRKPLIVFGNWTIGRIHILFDLKRILSIVRILVKNDDYKELQLTNDLSSFLNSLEEFLSAQSSSS